MKAAIGIPDSYFDPFSGWKSENGSMQTYLDDLASIKGVTELKEPGFFDGMKDSWIEDVGPVIDQGHCASCWAVSYTDVYTGLVNRYVPKKVLTYYA